MGVPSSKSMPASNKLSCPFLYSIPSSFTALIPIAFGLNVARVANTPFRSFPPKRGGRTMAE